MSPDNMGSYVFFWLPKRYFFHLVSFSIRNVVYLGGFKGTMEA